MPFSQDNLIGGRYRVVSRLGRGGTSVVYKAEDLLEGRVVALKTPRPGEVSHPGRGSWKERFQREANAVERLDHPGIARFFELGFAGDTPYLVFECLAGRNLAEIVRVGPMRSEIVRELGVQLLDALEHAHRRGILHRDVKTANLMLLRGYRLKLIDFGISSEQCGSGRCEECAIPNEVCLDPSLVRWMGTPSYMSPEQRAGGAEDASSDLWAVGMVIYELLTGQRPDFEDVAGCLRKLIEMRDARAFVPVIASAWSEDPAERPASAAKMAERLRRVVVETDTSACRRGLGIA